MGTKFYHWGPREQEDWARKGFPNDDELKERIRRQNGYWISSDSMDTAGYGPSLIVWEAKRDLVLTEDLTFHPKDLTFHSSQDPLAILKPQVGTPEDIYRSNRFLSGKMDLYDFMRLNASFKLVSTPKLKEIYPIVHKMIENLPVSTREINELMDELLEAGTHFDSLITRIGPSPFGERVLKTYRETMITYLANYGLPKLKDHSAYDQIMGYYLAALKMVAPKIPCPEVYKPKETIKYVRNGNYQS